MILCFRVPRATIQDCMHKFYDTVLYLLPFPGLPATDGARRAMSAAFDTSRTGINPLQGTAEISTVLLSKIAKPRGVANLGKC